ANAGYGEKSAESLGIACDERKGLNRKPFCLFPCRCRALFHLVNLPFRNKSALPCRSCPSARGLATVRVRLMRIGDKGREWNAKDRPDRGGQRAQHEALPRPA